MQGQLNTDISVFEAQRRKRLVSLAFQAAKLGGADRVPGKLWRRGATAMLLPREDIITTLRMVIKVVRLFVCVKRQRLKRNKQGTFCFQLRSRHDLNVTGFDYRGARSIQEAMCAHFQARNNGAVYFLSQCKSARVPFLNFALVV